MICLRNNWNKTIQDTSLVNGMIGYITDIEHTKPKDKTITRNCVSMCFRPEFLEEPFNDLLLLHSSFEGKREVLYREEVNLYEKFDFGYCITTHKSQGSQFENLLIYDEILNYRNHNLWKYTAITRAINNLVLIQ